MGGVMAIDRWRSTVGYWDLSTTGTTEVSAIAQQRVASENRRPNKNFVQLSWGMSANTPEKTPMVYHNFVILFPDLKLPLMGVHSSFKPSSTVIHVSTLRLHRNYTLQIETKNHLSLVVSTPLKKESESPSRMGPPVDSVNRCLISCLISVTINGRYFTN